MILCQMSSCARFARRVNGAALSEHLLARHALGMGGATHWVPQQGQIAQLAHLVGIIVEVAITFLVRMACTVKPERRNA